MPYIKQERRDAIDSGAIPENAGELNYQITALSVSLLSGKREALPLDELSTWERNVIDLIERFLNSQSHRYSTMNDIAGALCGARFELRRQLSASNGDCLFGSAHTADHYIGEILTWFFERIVAPYEDEKIKLNGGIYEALS